MTHLEFVDKLDRLGISIRSTNVEGREKVICNVPHGLSSSSVVVKDFAVKWADGQYRSADAKEKLIQKSIDMDSWKHSWHNDISPENFEKFRVIIQQKIIDRARQIDELLTVYFMLGKEISDNETK